MSNHLQRSDPPADLAEAAAQLRLAITRTARRLRQEAGELSPSAAAALATVERHGPLTPSELADLERVSRPTVTRVVAALVERGLAIRTPDPEDRRSALVAVTPAGERALRRMRGRKNAYLARRLRGLEPAELGILTDAAGLLDRLLEDDGKRGERG